MRSSLPFAIAAGLFGLGAFVACAPDTGTDGAGANGAGAGNSTSSGNGTSSGGGDSSSSTGFDVTSSASGGTECASETIEAELAPLTMFIMFDKSGSMGTNNMWNPATNALKGFFADPSAAGLEVALRFFPDGQCSGNNCNNTGVNACATPLVDAAPLTAESAPADAHEAALIAAVNSRSPDGGTPMSIALDGAIRWSTNYANANPEHKVVVILVTDGEPVGCGNVSEVVNIAQNGYAMGISTFTIGLFGSNQTTINNIANAGGGQAFFLSNANNTQTELLAALQAIRGQQLACDLAIPQPTEGTFNKDLVNVEYTPGGSSQGQTIGKVPNEAACGAGGGWYYDNEANPTRILLCPSTCDTARADESGKISVVLGCDTIPA